MECTGFDPVGPYVGGVVAFVDCRALDLAQRGWHALAGGAWLTAVLTIAVALLGYRLMLGQARGRDAMMLALRMGVVLALVTQWPAWEAVVYRVAVDGPETLALAMMGDGGARGDLAARYDHVLRDLDEVSRTDAVQTAQDKVRPGGHVLSTEAGTQLARAGGWISGAALGGLMAPRVIVALLLAVGPLCVGALAWGGAQGLFVGWLRVCLGAMLASVAGSVLLGLEWSVVAPQMALLLSQMGGDGANATATRIAGTAGLFAVVLPLVAWTVMRAAWAIDMPGTRHGAAVQVFPGAPDAKQHIGQGTGRTVVSRSRHFAEGMVQSLRREERFAQVGTGERAARDAGHMPLGQSGRAAGRRMPRASGAARKRDGHDDRF